MLLRGWLCRCSPISSIMFCQSCAYHHLFPWGSNSTLHVLLTYTSCVCWAYGWTKYCLCLPCSCCTLSQCYSFLLALFPCHTVSQMHVLRAASSSHKKSVNEPLCVRPDCEMQLHTVESSHIQAVSAAILGLAAYCWVKLHVTQAAK